MPEFESIADLLAQAETNRLTARETARKRLALLDEERASIKALLGRKPRTPSASKKLGVERKEQK